MSDRTLTMLAVGDVILQTSKPAEPLVALVAPVLKSADVVVGQGEVIFTSRGVNTFVEMWAPAVPCEPRNLRALSVAGFSVITLAGNHIYDSGAPGIEDTIAGLQNYGIAAVGAGMNIDQARRPAVIEREGTRFGFLAYNCIGPKGSWATPDKPGCAYVDVLTHYEMEFPNPGGPPVPYSFAEPRSLEAMIEDIRRLRPLCDVLVVSFHKGILYLARKVAAYEEQISHAAIDAGADLIVGHHAHVLQGIEQYKGKTIFHGLGNFVVYAEQFLYKLPQHSTPPTGWWTESNESSAELPFRSPIPPAKGRQTIIAKCTIDGGRISRVSYLPCLINEQGQPEILKNNEKGIEVFDYMAEVTRAAGLNARYKWEGDEVVISEEFTR